MSILKDVDSLGNKKTSMSKIFLLITFSIYIILTIYIIVKINNSDTQVNIEEQLEIFEPLQWLFLVLTPYVFGTKTLEFIKTMVVKGK